MGSPVIKVVTGEQLNTLIAICFSIFAVIEGTKKSLFAVIQRITAFISCKCGPGTQPVEPQKKETECLQVVDGGHKR